MHAEISTKTVPLIRVQLVMTLLDKITMFEIKEEEEEWKKSMSVSIRRRLIYK